MPDQLRVSQLLHVRGVGRRSREAKMKTNLNFHLFSQIVTECELVFLSGTADGLHEKFFQTSL